MLIKTPELSDINKNLFSETQSYNSLSSGNQPRNAALKRCQTLRPGSLVFVVRPLAPVLWTDFFFG